MSDISHINAATLLSSAQSKPLRREQCEAEGRLTTDVPNTPGVANGLATAARRSAASLVTYRDYRLLWLSNFFYFGGAWTQTLVLSWLVFRISDSATVLAIFTSLRLSPMLLGPIGGAFADRFDHYNLILTGTGIGLAGGCACLVLQIVGHLSVVPICAFGLLLGLTMAPLQPARISVIWAIVHDRDAVNAVALNTIGVYATVALGPSAGGFLLAYAGAVPALIVVNLFFLGSLLWFMRIGRASTAESAPTAVSSLARGLLEAANVVFSDRAMSAVLWVSLAANVFAFPSYQAFLPVFADEVFHVDAAGLGVMFAGVGTGAILGSGLLAMAGDRAPKGPVFLGSTAAFGLSLVIFAVSGHIALGVAALFLLGLGMSGFVVLQSTILATLSPTEMRGRILGFQTLTIGILPLSTLGQGALISRLGVVDATIASGVSLALVTAFIAQTNPRLRRI